MTPVHVMQPEPTDASDGIEWWLCPECGRRISLRWEPYSKTVWQVGDEGAEHTGGKELSLEVGV